MNTAEAFIIYGLAEGDLSLACAAASVWKLGEDNAANRLQFRRVFGSMLPDSTAAHAFKGEAPKDAKARTERIVTGKVDVKQAQRIAQYMKLRHLPEREMMARWDAVGG